MTCIFRLLSFKEPYEQILNRQKLNKFYILYNFKGESEDVKSDRESNLGIEDMEKTDSQSCSGQRKMYCAMYVCIKSM